MFQYELSKSGHPVTDLANLFIKALRQWTLSEANLPHYVG